MSDAVTLLPPEASPRELAISEAVAAWLTIPVELLDTIWDPRTCPEAWLPYLAWAVGLPLWSAAWDAPKRRSVVAAWIAISRIRGTRDAFAACLDIVDAKLVDWLVPPAICAPRPARTQAERDAYKAQFPEVRVYPFAGQAVRRGVLVPGRPWGRRLRFLQPSTADARAAYRAEYRDGDVVKPITVRFAATAGDIASGDFELRAPSVGVRRLVPGRPWGGATRFALPSTAAARVYRYNEGTARPDLLWPSATPIDTVPDKVAAPHVLPGRLVVGRPWGGSRRVPRPSVASQFVYDSVRLFVPDRPVVNAKARRGGWILGRTQLGQPRFRIDVAVDTTYRRPGRRFMPGQVLRGVTAPHDGSRTAEVCAALRAAKLGRDKVMLRTGLYRPVEPQDQLLPNAALLPGQIIRTA